MRRAAKIFLFLILGLVLLAAGLFGALQLSAVQRQIAARLPGLTGGLVEVQGLEGNLPQHLRIAHLALRDKQGVWLEIERLALDWQPLAWLHHEVSIDRLEIARVHVIRTPVAEPEAAKPSEPFRFPDLPRLSVAELAVAEIALEPAVAGQAQRLSLSGRATPKADGQGFSLALDTIEGTPTQLRAEGSLSGQTIIGTLQAQEAPGGLFGHLAQIAPEASLRLAAQGKWDGAHLNATLRAVEGRRAEGEMVLADLSVASQETHYALRAEGVWPSQLRAQETLAPLRAESGADYHLVGEAWAEGGAWRWRITQGNLGSVTLASDGSWPQESGSPLQAQATIDAPLAPWSALAGRRMAGQAHLQAKAEGALNALRTNAEILLSSLMLDGQALPETHLTALAVQDGSAWNLTPLELHLGEVTATGQAHYDAPNWNATFDLPPVALAAWRALLPPDSLPAEFGGTLGMQLHAEGRDADWSAQAHAALDGLRGLPEAARGVVGPKAQLAAGLSQSGGALTIESAELTSAGGLHATTSGTLKDGVADLRAQAKLADARVLGKGIPGGAPELNATWKGKPDAGDATFQLAWIPTGLPKLEAEGKASLSAELIRLGALRARFGPAELTAEGTLPRTSDKGGKADAHLSVPDLGPLGKLAGQPLAGSVTGEAILDGKAAKATLDAKDIRSPGVRAAALQLRAAIADWPALDGLTAQLRGTALSGANWTLDALQASAKSEAKPKDAPTPPIAWNLALQGSAQDQPLALSIAGRWRQPKPAQQVLELASLTGHALGEPLTLAAPTMASFGPDALSLSPTRIGWGALHVAARLTQQQGQVDGMVALEKVELDRLRNLGSLPRGTLEAQATLKGPAAAPNAAWNVTAHLTPAAGTNADMTLSGTWNGGAGPTPITTTLHATTAQTGGASGSLDGNVATAGHLSLKPMIVDVPPGAPLSGRISGRLPLALLNNWLRADGHKLDGVTKLDLQLAGTLGAPKPGGALTLENASYDHLPSGLCLRNLQGEIQAGPDQLRLTSLSATDADRHRMDLHGTIGLGGAKPVDLTLAMPAHHLFCGGMASGDMAGNLHVKGTLAERLLASGTLTVGPMAVTLPEGDKAGDIPQLKVIEPKKKAKEDKSGIVDLSIDVSVPSRLFVRGRGLDAEFAGDLKVRGTADAPDVTGDLSTKRGRFTLLDRQLSLTRAILRFAGPVPPSPSLDILAETSVQATTLRVTLTGSALAPKLELSSTPALPSDEVLALLLFGRKLESISAFQALQLAQAARQLAGKGGGPGAIDSVRNLLGLDTLSLDQDASGESTVGTGKYLADGVYVGLEQGRKPESRKVLTEIEVIPDVNVQTSTTSDGQTGGGVEWKWDY